MAIFFGGALDRRVTSGFTCRLYIGLSSWGYGETCIPKRMDNLHTILSVTDVKLWCDKVTATRIAAFELFGKVKF
jgi:hypothetical protein